MNVYVIFNGDSWLSSDSLSLVAVCSSNDKAIELILNDVRAHYGIVERNDVDESDCDEDGVYLEDIAKELNDTNQCNGIGWAYMIQEVEMDATV